VPSLPEGFNALVRGASQEWNKGAMMTLFHLQALQKQVVQVHQALALALLTNRTLVLPRVQCFCYRGWFMNTLCRWAADAWAAGLLCVAGLLVLLV
jgi:hypothetical protein